MGWGRLHPYNISQKVEIVVEHFRQHVAPLLNGTAKAMVVVGSRQEAVRWQLAIDKFIKDRGYAIRSLVAFSGEVTDKDSGHDPFTENSLTLNPNLRGRDIREAYKTDEYQILLVANKFQTGFDQPLLCGMYVAKRLAGIQAVQTLWRLNRSYKTSGFNGVKKDTTYVLEQFQAGCSGTRESSGLKSHDFSDLLPLHPKWNCSRLRERHHRGAGIAHRDEHSNTEFRDRPQRTQRRVARPGSAVRKPPQPSGWRCDEVVAAASFPRRELASSFA